MSTQLARRLLARLPRRTVRFRLTLLYGGLFLVAGSAVLALTYVLVAHATGRSTLVENIDGTPRITHSDNAAATLVPRGVNSQLQQLRHQVAQQRAADQHQLLVQSGIALGAATLLAFAVGWFVAGRVLRPLRAMTCSAQQISQHNLHERLAVHGPDDEVKELADTIDGLLGRLETAFDAQRRFIANVSHELRTPLTWERALAEVSLADPEATPETLRGTIQELIVSGQDQERLIDALLTLATSERGLDRHDPVDIAALAGEVLRQRQDQMPGDVELHADLAETWTAGSPELLKRLIANLVDNAVRYNYAGGYLAVSTSAREDRVLLTISNTGPMIKAGDIDRLLRPFERLTRERTGHRDGHGLGLSIVAAIATAHGADLSVKPRRAGGLHVAVSLRRDRGTSPALTSQPHPVAAAGARIPSQR
jgi:signal transduction histidine kinase